MLRLPHLTTTLPTLFPHTYERDVIAPPDAAWTHEGALSSNRADHVPGLVAASSPPAPHAHGPYVERDRLFQILLLVALRSLERHSDGVELIQCREWRRVWLAGKRPGKMGHGARLLASARALIATTGGGYGGDEVEARHNEGEGEGEEGREREEDEEDDPPAPGLPRYVVHGVLRGRPPGGGAAEHSQRWRRWALLVAAVSAEWQCVWRGALELWRGALRGTGWAARPRESAPRPPAVVVCVRERASVRVVVECEVVCPK